MGQAAFAVVREKHDVVQWQEVGKRSGLRGQHFCLGGVFKVHTQQLLLTADHPQFDCGFQVRIATKMGANAGFTDQRFELVAGFIIAHHRQQGRLGAQCDHVECHIGSAAVAIFFAGDAYHRHRRLGRDTVHGTKPVAVEHHVTHHQNAGLGECIPGNCQGIK